MMSCFLLLNRRDLVLFCVTILTSVFLDTKLYFLLIRPENLDLIKVLVESEHQVIMFLIRWEGEAFSWAQLPKRLLAWRWSNCRFRDFDNALNNITLCKPLGNCTNAGFYLESLRVPSINKTLMLPDLTSFPSHWYYSPSYLVSTGPFPLMFGTVEQIRGSETIYHYVHNQCTT